MYADEFNFDLNQIFVLLKIIELYFKIEKNQLILI